MTLTIELTQQQVTCIDVDDADLADVSWCAAFNPSYAGGGKYTAQRSERAAGRTRTILLHRVILGRVIGRELASTEMVDHIDRDPLNNRRGNLRLATHSQNGANRGAPANSTSGYKGVYWNKVRQRWIAHIRTNGKVKYLGAFDTPEAAHAAYAQAAAEAYGAFACVDG